MNGKYFINHLKRELLPACSELYEGENYYFMQDGAPSYTANITQEYLKENFGRRFIRKDQWPPNSPDCNLLDYFFFLLGWGCQTKGVWRTTRTFPEHRWVVKTHSTSVEAVVLSRYLKEGNPAVSAKIESSSEGKWWPHQITFRIVIIVIYCDLMLFTSIVSVWN